MLNWKAECTTESKTIIERSADGRGFYAIGSLSLTSNNSTYSYTDTKPLAGANYYRLKFVDADGNTSYSDIIQLQLSSSSSLKISPNPAGRSFVVLHPQADGQSVLSIYTLSGILVHQYLPAKGVQQSRVTLSNASTGTYYVVWKGKVESTSTQLVVR